MLQTLDSLFGKYSADCVLPIVTVPQVLLAPLSAFCLREKFNC